MKTIKLSEDRYRLLRSLDLSAVIEEIQFDDENHSFSMDDFGGLLLELTYIATVDGMDKNQNYATEYGWEICRLYDDIYYQL